MVANIPDEQLWMVIVGFIIAFFLAFGIGANDVANSFGTSVGARVLTLRQACILATVCETAGAVLLGVKVSNTIRKGITSTDGYRNVTDDPNATVYGPEIFMIGQVSTLSGSCLWMFVATILRVPVSGTHSIVGATLGFSLVAMGGSGVQWKTLGKIVGSWFISPAMSGLFSILLFFFIKKTIIEKADPLEPGLLFLPVAYGVTIVINVFSIFFHRPQMLGLHRLPEWGVYPVSFGIGIIATLIVKFLVVPWRRQRITSELREEAAALLAKRAEERDAAVVNNNSKPALNASPVKGAKKPPMNTDLSSVKAPLLSDGKEVEKNNGNVTQRVPRVGFSPAKKSNGVAHTEASSVGTEAAAPAAGKGANLRDRPEQAKLFSWLQILTAIFGSFAHGGNDVSNAIGPVVGLWLTAVTQKVANEALTPIWILLYGGAGISVGLWVLGRRVIKTLGEDLTQITPSSGLCIELGAAFTVLLASNVGIPISTTHCKVGSVVAVGYFRSRDNVNWRIFRNILLAWLVTLPISGGLSALIFFFLRKAA